MTYKKKKLKVQIYLQTLQLLNQLLKVAFTYLFANTPNFYKQVLIESFTQNY